MLKHTLKSFVRIQRHSFPVIHQVRNKYSDKVLEHYNNPRNTGSLDKNNPYVGTGIVGAPSCGDVMKLQIEIDPETGRITESKFRVSNFRNEKIFT